MRNLTLLLTLSLLLGHVSPSCGDWFYDFDDGIIPDTFMTEGYADLLDTPSETFEASADGGVLRMWDPIQENAGGSLVALGFNDEVFGGNVRISAEINSAGTTNDFIGMRVRASDTPGDKSGYYARINFNQSDWNGGVLYVGKDVPSGDTFDYANSSWRMPTTKRSYFLELEVIDDPMTGFPEIFGRLFDRQGGTLLTAVSLTDANLSGFPPLESGTADVTAWTDGTDVIDASFDDIGAQQIPEPSTLLLCILALGVVGISLIPRRNVLD